jgi:hypothetical protein
MALVLALFHSGLWNCGCARIYPNRFDVVNLTRVCCFYSASIFFSHPCLGFVILGELNKQYPLTLLHVMYALSVCKQARNWGMPIKGLRSFLQRREGSYRAGREMFKRLPMVRLQSQRVCCHSMYLTHLHSLRIFVSFFFPSFFISARHISSIYHIW